MREWLRKKSKDFEQFFLNYLVALPLFFLGVWIAIETGLGTGLGIFLGGALGIIPILVWAKITK